jgi:hypothetical protein
MADITMCTGIRHDGVRCPMRDKCYRFTAPPGPVVQSWLVGAPFTMDLHDQEPQTMWQAECSEFLEPRTTPTVTTESR